MLKNYKNSFTNEIPSCIEPNILWVKFHMLLPKPSQKLALCNGFFSNYHLLENLPHGKTKIGPPYARILTNATNANAQCYKYSQKCTNFYL